MSTPRDNKRNHTISQANVHITMTFTESEMEKIRKFMRKADLPTPNKWIKSIIMGIIK